MRTTTIPYQGQDIAVTRVNCMSGDFTTSTGDVNGDEDLYHDAAGHYYLRRKLDYLDGECERPASGRVHVHRLSATAAILWATTRLNSDTLDLRCDAAALLPKRAPCQPAAPSTQPTTTAVDDTENGTTRLEFTYTPTPARVGGRMKIHMDAKQMELAEKLADHFCVGARQFLALLALNDLPDQPSGNGEAGDLLYAEHVRFTCKGKGRASRVRRAVKASGLSLEGFVAAAVSSWVKMYEDDMIVHPRTGRLLHADRHELFTRGQHEVTAAPVGKEHEPQWQRDLYRQYVSFSAHLTTEQMERLEYPHMVHDCASDRELPCVLIPYDAEEGLPYLRVGGRDVAPAEATATIPVYTTEQLSRLGREKLAATTAPLEAKGAA